ncbi:glycosyltransferase [Occallatibacter riparius]|uniref:Glycosyltransferase n=1 Tax=Occallatibacter riparius TaxID=1002689 RepID=A0A9J7BP72_9BACT|nr:glycosyltransferase [Occallatibacter riparius]UWZ84684.1 glycosyltransferase [Occallatibacter riparius]
MSEREAVHHELNGHGLLDRGPFDRVPRVAYFPDSFHEINGVAHTSRNFEAFARRRGLPFLCVRAGDREQKLTQEDNVWILELPRGFLSFALEKDLRFDPAFMRHLPQIEDALARFEPDLIHITGPSEVGMLGAALAHTRDLPLAASWHTNVHEYAARRLQHVLQILPKEQADAVGQKIEGASLAVATRIYSIADVLFAPNLELCDMLERTTSRQCFLMPRGVDAELFHPRNRTRLADDRQYVLGFCGRLSVEKNVALLATVQEQLEQIGVTNFRFMIVGHGAEEQWLREHLPRAEFTGVLTGNALAAAYANMDVFVFPSHTDTFGNVVLEALASGLPAIVTPEGGPKSIVRDGETGRIVPDEEFATAIAELLGNAEKLEGMRVASRGYAETASWDAVFEGVYRGYETALSKHRQILSRLPNDAAHLEIE